MAVCCLFYSPDWPIDPFTNVHVRNAIPWVRLCSPEAASFSGKKMTLTVEFQLTNFFVGRANFSVRYCRRQIGQCEQHIKQRQVGVYMLLFKDA